LKLAAIAVLGVMALGLGAMVLARQAPRTPQDNGQTEPVSTPAKDNLQPTVLRLFGTTAYDPSTLTVVRSLIDNCRVDEVLVDLGATVKRGDPLLKITSSDLAAAVSDYELACTQWKHDKRIYDYKVPLAKENSIAKKELFDVEDNEARSRLKMRIAKDKLLGYGLTEKEIANAPTDDELQKGKFILRSRADGIVVKETVVRGNYYEGKDELMVITPLDRLHIIVNVSETDAENVMVGQALKVIFPFASQPMVAAKVDYVDRTIDPETRMARFRTTIPNPQGRYKAGAFVRVAVDLDGMAKSTPVTNALVPSQSNLNLDARLNEVERKLKRLLDENDSRAPDARILKRLDELERKLDRVLELRAR
jgi:membrane fusion protein, heavy metal efflux system